VTDKDSNVAEELQPYVTSDLGLAAYLMATDHKIVNTPHSKDDYKVFFMFEPSKTLPATVLSFYNDTVTLNVNAKRYKESMDSIKALVHNSPFRSRGL
jgi:hypothetical protein